ncbi:hypothetical protein LP420_38765 [Massilia sp. B-10]|nr:hypothetical protein LP420_38765 [Massilia sp. B-10]
MCQPGQGLHIDPQYQSKLSWGNRWTCLSTEKAHESVEVAIEYWNRVVGRGDHFYGSDICSFAHYMRTRCALLLHFFCIFKPINASMSISTTLAGFSIAPLQRVKRFATEIDMARSMQVCCAPADMLRLEDVLHAWFDDFNVHLELFRDIDGRTEWFYLVPAPLEESRMIHAARRQASRTRLKQRACRLG